MWVVDDFIDRIAARDEKRIARDNKWRANWKHKPLVTFDTKEAALDFMLDRAKQRVLQAGKELAAAHKRLKRCERKRQLAHSATDIEEMGPAFSPEKEGELLVRAGERKA